MGNSHSNNYQSKNSLEQYNEIFSTMLTLSQSATPQSKSQHAPGPFVATEVPAMNQFDPLVVQRLKSSSEYNDYNRINPNNRTVLGPYRYTSDGSTYIGQYNNGLREGFGMLILVDGSLFQGHWSNDKLNCNGNVGNGRAFYKNGDIYTGNFTENDNLNGQGKPSLSLFFSKKFRICCFRYPFKKARKS